MEQVNNNGLEAIVWITNYYKKNVTKEQLRHAIGLQATLPTEWDIRECAHTLGYETELISLSHSQLNSLPLPALVYFEGMWKILDSKNEIVLINPENNEQQAIHDITFNTHAQLDVLLIKEQQETEQKRLLVLAGLFLQ